jgi:hypothetical protein
MALNQWSKRSLMFAAAIFAAVGFLIGSSWGQEGKNPQRVAEIGRYQMLATPQGGFVIFDTETARYWVNGAGYFPPRDQWKATGSPFQKEAP